MGPLLIRLSIPMIWGMLTMVVFSLVDAVFIGMLGSQPLAALGFILPVVMVVTSVAMGIGVGMASVISRAAGKGLSRRVAKLTTHGLFLSSAMGLALVAIGLVAHDSLFRLIGADGTLLPQIRNYMIPWFVGAAFLVVPMASNSAMRAAGDTFTPSLIMAVAAATNALLDPLLIFGIGPFPRLEMQGAAIATGISYVVALILGLHTLALRRRMILLEWPALPDLIASWRRLLSIAIPAMGTNLLLPLASALLTCIVAQHGESAVAMFGVGMRVTSLAMVAPLALATVMTAYAGQNFGAKREDRVLHGLRFALRFCIFAGFIQWALLALFARPIAGCFTRDPVIIECLGPLLFWVPLGFAGFGYMLSVAASFSAIGQPKYSAVLFVARLFVFTVPLAMLGSHIAGLEGIYAAIFCGNLASGLFAHALKHRVFETPTSVTA